ncbi:FMN-binding protein [Pseudomonadota bacterium]|nr:FMN-binding protein [Xanthomonadales bacterium]
METVYQSPADFLGEYLPGCRQEALWLSSDLKAEIERLVEHSWHGLRVRYCRQGEKTAWILDEIGKTEPITSGVVVNEGRVERVRVLIFRESRGAEVNRSAFTRQYDNASLGEDHSLDRNIDGITGATLSVWALNRQVKLALLLDRFAKRDSDDD